MAWLLGVERRQSFGRAIAAARASDIVRHEGDGVSRGRGEPQYSPGVLQRVLASIARIATTRS
jgi:hypothetical protein